MPAPTNAPNFNSGTPASAWWTLAGNPNLIYVTQFDVLVRRLQRKAASGLLPSTFPSTTRRGNVSIRNIEADGLFGREATDVLGYVMNRSGAANEVPRLLANFNGKALSRETLRELIWASIYLTNLRGGSGRNEVVASAQKDAIQIQEPFTPPAFSRGSRSHATTVRSALADQDWVAYYNPLTQGVPRAPSQGGGYENVVPLFAAATPNFTTPLAVRAAPEPALFTASNATDAGGSGGSGGSVVIYGGGEEARQDTTFDDVLNTIVGVVTGADTTLRQAANPNSGSADTGNPGMEIVRVGDATVLPDERPQEEGIIPSYAPPNQGVQNVLNWPWWYWALGITGGAVVVGGVVYVATKAAKEKPSSAPPSPTLPASRSSS